MRIGMILIALAVWTACPGAERTAAHPTDAAFTASPPTPSAPTPAPAEVDDGALVLVEAELASRLQRGQAGAEEFCEADVPHLVLKGGVLDLQCGQRNERWAIEAEQIHGTRRLLKIAGGQTVTLEEQGRQRFRVSGSLCDKKPTVYVVFPEVRSFRARWLKSATCPTEDMKLAH